MATDDAQVWLTVDDAVAVFGVVSNTIRNWIDKKWLAAQLQDGAFRISETSLKEAKVLRDDALLARKEVKAHAIDARDIANALRAGAIRGTDGPDRRFSLVDAAALAAHKLGTWLRRLRATRSSRRHHRPTTARRRTPSPS